MNTALPLWRCSRVEKARCKPGWKYISQQAYPFIVQFHPKYSKLPLPNTINHGFVNKLLSDSSPAVHTTLYCTHSRMHYCFLLTSTVWESLLDRNHCFGQPNPAAVSQLKHVHPQQVIPHCETFMSDCPTCTCKLTCLSHSAAPQKRGRAHAWLWHTLPVRPQAGLSLYVQTPFSLSQL